VVQCLCSKCEVGTQFEPQYHQKRIDRRKHLFVCVALPLKSRLQSQPGGTCLDTQEAEDLGFKASLAYITRVCLKKEKKRENGLQ
jgi:hypothetical protein